MLHHTNTSLVNDNAAHTDKKRNLHNLSIWALDRSDKLRKGKFCQFTVKLDYTPSSVIFCIIVIVVFYLWNQCWMTSHFYNQLWHKQTHLSRIYLGNCDYESATVSLNVCTTVPPTGKKQSLSHYLFWVTLQQVAAHCLKSGMTSGLCSSLWVSCRWCCIKLVVDTSLVLGACLPSLSVTLHGERCCLFSPLSLYQW